MAPEERMLERFTKERQRSLRGSTFNLEDEDDLTHYGQSLSAMDDFDETGLGGLDDDEDEEESSQFFFFFFFSDCDLCCFRVVRC